MSRARIFVGVALLSCLSVDVWGASTSRNTPASADTPCFTPALSPLQICAGQAFACAVVNEPGGYPDPAGFARSLASLGNLDRDSDQIPDLAVGTYGDNDGGGSRGAVWIFFLRPDGSPRDSVKISSIDTPCLQLDDSDFFGESLSSLGDLDHDGLEELAVGASLDDDAGRDAGAVWILSLDTLGVVNTCRKIINPESADTTRSREDRFGISLAWLGDHDHNPSTPPILAVGAFQDDDGGSDRGALWLVSLGPDLTILDSRKITTELLPGQVHDSDFFGISACSLGDLDRDGITDLAVGATRDDDGGPDHGAVYILFPRADRSIRSVTKISSTSGGFSGSLSERSEFGASLTRMNDLDNNGVSDLSVGSWGDDDGGPDRGALWHLSFGPNRDGTVISQCKISDSTGPECLDLLDRDELGISVAHLGDIDGDGHVECAVGSMGTYGSRGQVWILSLEGQLTTVPQAQDHSRVRARQLVAIPNPTRESTEFRFRSEGGPVDLDIVDASGRRVRRLVSQKEADGHFTAFWDARDHLGRRAVPGVYFAILRGSGSSEISRVVIVP